MKHKVYIKEVVNRYILKKNKGNSWSEGFHSREKGKFLTNLRKKEI